MNGTHRNKGPGGSPGRPRIPRARRLAWAALAFLLLAAPASAQSSAPVKAAVFNFGVRNLEASGYGTTVTNSLLADLKGRPNFAVLDRKELETFLALNDLRQDDSMDNVLQVGTRLGLNVIVTGSVERSGTVLTIRCKVVQVEQRRPVLDVRLTAFGDAGLSMELKNLGDMIAGAVAEAGRAGDEAPSLRGPVTLQKKSGDRKIYLSWESPPGTTGIAGWEVFRGSSAAGPFARIAQVNRSEFWDQEVERNRTYHYKVRSFGTRGGYSEFSAVVSAESAPTPNPPVILRTDSRVRGVQLTWLPSPTATDDPLKFKGYKLYRAKAEDGPYREVRDVPGRDPGQGGDGAGTGKVIFVDTGIGDGERFFYRVTAYNEKGLESDFSRALAGSSLPRVGDVRAAGERIREVPLSWKPVESPFVRGYHVYRSDKPSGTFSRILRIPADGRGPDGRVAAVDRQGLGDKQTWYYRVTAFEEEEIETSPSDTVSAVTRDKPPTPQGFRAEGGRVKRVPLAWRESPREDVRGYRVYRAEKPEGPFESIARLEGRASTGMTDEGGVLEGGSAPGMGAIGGAIQGGGKALGLGALVGTLQDGTEYFYRVTSFNEKDVESEPSPVAAARTKARPKAPSGFRGEASDGRVLLTWQAGLEPDIQEYHLYERGLFGLEKIASVPGTSHTLEGLAKGKSRVFSIRSVDRDGLESDAAPEITVTAK